eukprot:483501_1
MAELDEKSLIDNETKQNENNNWYSIQLFNKYSNCYSIINEQSLRLDQITTEKYLLELNNHQDALPEEIQEYETKLLFETKQYENKRKKYEMLKEQRTELQNKIKTELKKCNDMIKQENDLYQELGEIKDNENMIDDNIGRLKSSLDSCVSILKLYNEFTKNNKMYIDKINGIFDNCLDNGIFDNAIIILSSVFFSANISGI